MRRKPLPSAVPADQHRIPAWPHGPTAPLPRSVTPFASETVQSYLDRLASANHLSPSALRRYLTNTARRSEPRPDWLARASGIPETILKVRLVGLADDDDRDANWQRRYARPACRLCMARRQVHQPVHCWYPAHRTVCYRHHRWIGPLTRTLDDQRDLRAAPGVVAAARRHAQLYRHNLGTADYALREAQRILRWWSVAETAVTRTFPATDVDSYLAAYPDLIDLAVILVDSDRQIHSTTQHTPGRARAVAALHARIQARFPDRSDHGRAVEQWLYDHHLVAQHSRHRMFSGNTAAPSSPRRRQPPARIR